MSSTATAAQEHPVAIARILERISAQTADIGLAKATVLLSPLSSRADIATAATTGIMIVAATAAIGKCPAPCLVGSHIWRYPFPLLGTLARCHGIEVIGFISGGICPGDCSSSESKTADIYIGIEPEHIANINGQNAASRSIPWKGRQKALDARILVMWYPDQLHQTGDIIGLKKVMCKRDGIAEDIGDDAEFVIPGPIVILDRAECRRIARVDDRPFHLDDNNGVAYTKSAAALNDDRTGTRSERDDRRININDAGDRGVLCMQLRRPICKQEKQYHNSNPYRNLHSTSHNWVLSRGHMHARSSTCTPDRCSIQASRADTGRHTG